MMFGTSLRITNQFIHEVSIDTFDTCTHWPAVTVDTGDSAPPRKKPRQRNNDGNSDGSDYEEDDDNSMIDTDDRFPRENEAAVQMLQQYITSHSDIGKVSTRKVHEETTHGRKPVKALSDSDFDREQKELMTKKLRLEVKIMEDQRRFWSSISGNVDKIITAVDLFIERATRDASNDHSIPVMYTNQDGSVLHAAYSDSINPTSELI